MIKNYCKELMGAICGDVIGSYYEHKKMKTVNFPLFTNESTFTDDSVLTVAVAEWIRGGAEPSRLPVLLKEFSIKYPHRGYGTSYKKWVRRDTLEPYNSFGNGSAMRASAAGWVCDTLEDTLELARQTAAATHNHIEGIKGAQAVAACIFLARTGYSKDEIMEYIEETFDYDLDRLVCEIRPKYKFEGSCQKTVPEAIICWLESSTYEVAIRKAISLGGDADTLACITGSICAATEGMEIPEEIYNRAWNLLDDELRESVKTFHDYVENKAEQ